MSTTLFTIAMALKLTENSLLKGVQEATRGVCDMGSVVDKVARSAGAGLTSLAEKATKISENLKGTAEKLEHMAFSAGSFGAAALAGISGPIKAFEELEDAQTRMEMAYLDSGGKSSAYFADIKKQVVDLGNALPGTTRDFAELATALKENGINENVIAGGALKSSAYLRTIFNEKDSRKVAEIAAGSMHAFNLHADQMLPFIDNMQRAHYAFGLSLEDFKYATPYIARVYGALNPEGGLKAAKNITMMMGMLKQGGMEGSSIGTAIGDFYKELAIKPDMISEATRGKKLKALQITQKLGVNFDIFENGKFIGEEAMFKKIWALKKKGATQEEVLKLGDAYAGATGSAMFVNIYKQGEEGWTKYQEKMANQLSLDEKIKRLLGTFKNIKESAMGTIENLSAVVGSALGPALKSTFGKINDWASNLQVFFEKQEKGNTIVWTLTKALMGTVAVVGVAAIVFGALAFATSGILKLFSFLSGSIGTVIRLGIAAKNSALALRMLEIANSGSPLKSLMLHVSSLTAGLRGNLANALAATRSGIMSLVVATRAWTVAQLTSFRANFLTISGLKGMAVAFGSSLTNGIKGAIVAVRAFSIALLTSPIGWIALAIGAAAFLIYKYWQPISGFFKGLWQGLKEGLKGLEPAWNIFKRVVPLIFPILIPLKLIYGAIKALFKPVDDVGGKAQNMGLRFGRAIGGILSSVLQLPAKMLAAGANIIDSLFKGMMAKIEKPINAMKGLAQRLRNFLPFSPAKEGALRDINRVRIVETIADSIKPAPMINAMRAVTAATMIAATPVMPVQSAMAAKAAYPVTQQFNQALQPRTVPIPVSELARPAVSAAKGGAMQITFSPQITIQGGGQPEQVKNQVNEVMRMSFTEFERMMKQYENNKQRRSF